MTCPNDQHDWRLVETGYERQWSIEIDDDTNEITAFYGGSEDFSDEGAGDEHLRCSLCLVTKPLPDGVTINYE